MLATIAQEPEARIPEIKQHTQSTPSLVDGETDVVVLASWVQVIIDGRAKPSGEPFVVFTAA